MAAPDLLHGAWGRRWVSVGGGAQFETQSVVWLQGGTRYADIRVPFHPAAGHRCFAGRSGWDGDRYRWTHRLDLDAAAVGGADDVADLAWEDGALIERAMFPVAYTEVWDRLPGADGTWQVVEGADGCLVRVGRHAITVVDGRSAGGAFAACYRVLGPGGWRVELAVGDVGDVGDLPGPGEPTPGWRVVHLGDTAVVAV